MSLLHVIYQLVFKE